MKAIFKIIPIIIILVILFGLACSNVLILAEDTSEGTPGVDMAATWNITSGFNWIYPGSTHNSQGQTLHNILLDRPNDPYQSAKEMMENTYNISPNLCIVINNTAAERIFGGDIISDIRSYDWGQGYDRGDAVSNAMSNYKINYLGVIQSIFTGDIHIFFI